MSRIRTIKIETHKAGQPAPYRDHEYEATISVHDGEVPVNLNDEVILRYVKTLFKDFKDEGEAEWFHPKLVGFDKMAPGVWFVRIEQAYTG